MSKCLLNLQQISRYATEDPSARGPGLEIHRSGAKARAVTKAGARGQGKVSGALGSGASVRARAEGQGTGAGAKAGGRGNGPGATGRG